MGISVYIHHLKSGLLLGLIAASISVWGLTRAEAAPSVEFPDEELATESVLPVFEKPEGVKNRAIVTDGRIELGPTASYSLLEPLFNQASFGGTGTYHFNETSGLNIFGTYFLTGLNENGNNLNPIQGPAPQRNLNAQYAPQPKYLGLANYEFTPFYGKISLTKDFVMNLSLYGFIGGGAIGIGDGIAPIANIGLGQKLYFGQNFAIRADLRFMGYSGPDILSRDLATVTSQQSASSFDKKWSFPSLVSVSAVFLL